MRGFGLHTFLSLILFTSLAAAWPWPDTDERIEGVILRRQNDPKSDLAATSSITIKPSSETAAATDGPSSTGTNTGKASAARSDNSAAATSDGAAATSGATDSSNSTTKHASKTTAIDPRLPPGGVEMVTPAPIGGAQYYKIGDYVTFAWNYTSLSVTPTAIDIIFYFSVNSQLYTIALNQSVEPTGAVTWDTGAYQSTATIPLLTETYTLVIYDAAEDISATAQAGYLAVQDQFYFGMYIPQAYTPLNGESQFIPNV